MGEPSEPEVDFTKLPIDERCQHKVSCVAIFNAKDTLFLKLKICTVVHIQETGDVKTS